MVKTHSPIVAILILLALAVSGCNLPARNAGPVSTPTAASTIPPAITVIPKDPDSTNHLPSPARPLQLPNSTAHFPTGSKSKDPTRLLPVSRRPAAERICKLLRSISRPKA